MIGWQRRVIILETVDLYRCMVGFPLVCGADVGREIEPVSRAVPLVRATLGHHLDLATSRAVEVRGLVEAGDAELLDALDRRGHHAARAATCLDAAQAGEIG